MLHFLLILALDSTFFILNWKSAYVGTESGKPGGFFLFIIVFFTLQVKYSIVKFEYINQKSIDLWVVSTLKGLSFIYSTLRGFDPRTF